MLETLLKEKEVKYKLYSKYVLLLRILKRQPSLDDERIKKVTLELADITIDLDTNLEQIYNLEITEAEKMPSVSARQEKDKRKRLLELSQRRQKEIEELFGSSDEDDGKSGYSSVLYQTEKMDKINSYLKIKKEQERIEAENRKLRLIEDDLEGVIKKYNTEVSDLESELKEAIDRAFDVLNFNNIDYDDVDYRINRLERDMIVNQGLLSFSRDSLDITSAEKKEIKKIDSNNTISCLYFELREKQLFFYIRQVINTKNTTFAESYKNLIIISRYLRERKDLQERISKKKEDAVDFLYTLINEQRVKYEKQLAVRTNLDDVKDTIERNLLEIRQYDGIINDSKDMQSLLSGIVEKEEEPLEGEYTYNLPTNESVMEQKQYIPEVPIFEIPTVDIEPQEEVELEEVKPVSIQEELTEDTPMYDEEALENIEEEPVEPLKEEPLLESNTIEENIEKDDVKPITEEVINEEKVKQSVIEVEDLPHTMELLVNNIKNRTKYRGSLLKIMNFVENQVNG